MNAGISQGSTSIPLVATMQSIKFFEASLILQSSLSPSEIEEMVSIGFNATLQCLPQVKFLKLNMDPSRGAWALRLASESLEIIDVSDSGKCAEITSCLCPKQRKFIGRMGIYGCGLRPSRADPNVIIGRSLRDLPSQNMPASFGFRGLNEHADGCMVQYL